MASERRHRADLTQVAGVLIDQPLVIDMAVGEAQVQIDIAIPGVGLLGMVIGVRNARRRLVGIGARVDVPASVTELLDSGRRVEAPLADVVVETPPEVLGG